MLLNTCSVRDMAEQKALGKMGMLGRIAKQRPGCGLRLPRLHGAGRGAELLKWCRTSTSSSARKNFIASRITSTSCSNENAPLLRDGRSAFFHRRYGGRERLAGNDPRPRLAGAAGDGVRFHHAGLQHALHFLHRAADARRRAQPHDRGDRQGSARAGRARRERGHAARPDRESLRPPRVSHGSDGKSPFVQLLEAVHDVDGLERLRFTSPHPIGFRADLDRGPARSAEALRARPSAAAIRVGPDSQGDASHLHRGKISCAWSIKFARARADIALTTDVIVGFPGETEEDYEKTRALVERVQFDNAFVFRYSPRSETPAAEMDGQVDEAGERGAQSGFAHGRGRGGETRRRTAGRAGSGDSLRRPEQDESPRA